MFTESVLGGGPGLCGRSQLQMGEEMLWSGLSGQRQPPEVLLHPSVRHQGGSETAVGHEPGTNVRSCCFVFAVCYKYSPTFGDVNQELL